MHDAAPKQFCPPLADSKPSPARRVVTFVVPAGTPETTCRGCRAPIYFVTTNAGKPMPVDCSTVDGTPPTSTAPGRGVTHFATCPTASRFRRRKGDS